MHHRFGLPNAVSLASVFAGCRRWSASRLNPATAAMSHAIAPGTEAVSEETIGTRRWSDIAARRMVRASRSTNETELVVAHRRARGVDLLGELGCYDDIYQLWYLRGPEGSSSSWQSSANGREGADAQRFVVSERYTRGTGGLSAGYVATWDPLRDPLGAEFGEKCLANVAPSIASSEENWRVLHSALVFPPPSQAGRRGFESHRPLSST